MGASESKAAQNALFFSASRNSSELQQKLIDFEMAVRKSSSLRKNNNNNGNDVVIADLRDLRKRGPSHTVETTCTPNQSLLHLLTFVCCRGSQSLTGPCFKFIEDHLRDLNLNQQCGREKITPLHNLVAAHPNGLHFHRDGVVVSKKDEETVPFHKARDRENENCLVFSELNVLPLPIIHNDPKCEIIEFLLAEGADPFMKLQFEYKEAHRETYRTNEYDVLMLAVQNDYFGAIREIVARFPKIVNERDRLGRNALSFACEGGNIEVVSCLLALCSRDDKEKPDGLGKTPFVYAAFKGHRHICEFLIKNGVDFAPSLKIYHDCSDPDFGHKNVATLLPPLPKWVNFDYQRPPSQENPYVLENYICGKSFLASSTATNLERVLVSDACMLQSTEIFKLLVDQTPSSVKRPLAGPFPYQCTTLHVLAAKVAYNDPGDVYAQSSITWFIQLLLDHSIDPWGVAGDDPVRDSEGHSCFEYALHPFLPIFSSDADALRQRNFVPRTLHMEYLGGTVAATMNAHNYQQQQQQQQPQYQAYVNIDSIASWAYFIKAIGIDDERMQFIRIVDTSPKNRPPSPYDFQVTTRHIQELVTFGKIHKVREIIFEECQILTDSDFAPFLEKDEAPIANLKSMTFYSCDRIQQCRSRTGHDPMLKMIQDNGKRLINVTRRRQNTNYNNNTNSLSFNNQQQMNIGQMFNNMGFGDMGNLMQVAQNMNRNQMQRGNVSININGMKF